MVRARGLARFAVFSLYVAVAGCGGPLDPADEKGGGAAAEELLAGGPNLTLENVWLENFCEWSGCSVRFHNTICNRGSATVWGSAIGSRWQAPETIYSSCSGSWSSMSTFGRVKPGQCIDMVTYGPGYVGSKVNWGTCLNYTGMVDMYCSNAETNEGDNIRAQRLCVQ